MKNLKNILACVASSAFVFMGSAYAGNEKPVAANNATWSTPTLSPYLYAHNQSGAYWDVNIPHQFKRGMKHFDNGNYEKATLSFNRILRISPRDPLANYYMGVSEQYLGNHGEAVKHLTTVYRYHKASPQVYAALGISLSAQGDYESARKLLAKLEYMANECAGECTASHDIEIATQVLTKYVTKI